MTISKNDVANLTQGHTQVLSPHGDRIGSVGRVYTSDDTGEPTWATVATGLFGTHETFIPLRDAEFSGHDLRIPYDKHTVKDAPRVAPDAHLTPDAEDELYRYYGLEAAPGTTAAAGQAAQHLGDQDTDRETGREDVRSHDDTADDRYVDRDRGDDSPAADSDQDRVAQPRSRDNLTADSPEGADLPGGPGEVTGPGERTTRLRRFVVTERVVQSVEELPEEGTPADDR